MALLLFDLDGVVYRGPEPVPGMPQLLVRRQALGDRIVYVTNNSRWHRSEYRARLEGMGAPITGDGIVSSARATALALVEGPETPRITMVLGGPGLIRELHDVGLRTVTPTAQGLATGPDALVVGIDFRINYSRLSIAADAVRRGVRFVVTNRDPVYPNPGGLQAGAGSIVAAVVTAGQREPDLVIGKPEPGLFREAAAIVGVPASDAIVVGDGLLTDIVAAHRVGARSILMLTGVSTQAQLDATPENARPTAVAHDAAELEAVLDRLVAEGTRAT